MQAQAVPAAQGKPGGNVAAERFLRRTVRWENWLAPSPAVQSEKVLEAAGTHLYRIQRRVPDRGWDRLPVPAVIQMYPAEAAQYLMADELWRQGLARAADVAANYAQRTGRVREAAAATGRVQELIRRQVWQAAVARWVGAWQCIPQGRGAGWALYPTLFRDDSRALPALVVAEQAALHHAMQALWLAAGLGLSPFEPLTRLWRWGYWPVGVHRGKFVLAHVTP